MGLLQHVIHHNACAFSSASLPSLHLVAFFFFFFLITAPKHLRTSLSGFLLCKPWTAVTDAQLELILLLISVFISIHFPSTLCLSSVRAGHFVTLYLQRWMCHCTWASCITCLLRQQRRWTLACLLTCSAFFTSSQLRSYWNLAPYRRPPFPRQEQKGQGSPNKVSMNIRAKGNKISCFFVRHFLLPKSMQQHFCQTQKIHVWSDSFWMHMN